VLYEGKMMAISGNMMEQNNADRFQSTEASIHRLDAAPAGLISRLLSAFVQRYSNNST
jgi:hypothetical protein